MECLWDVCDGKNANDASSNEFTNFSINKDDHHFIALNQINMSTQLLIGKFTHVCNWIFFQGTHSS